MQERNTEYLISKAQQGDHAAFDELVQQHRDRLESIVRARMGAKVRGKTEVDDILQETYLRAYNAIGDFAWRGNDSFLRWLVKIAEHLIWNASQKVPRTELALKDEMKNTATSPEQASRRNERFDRLEEAIAALRPDQREAIRLSRIEGLKISEIAERMGRSPGSVKMLVARALRQLKASFGDTESLHLPDRELEIGGTDDDER